MSSGIFDFFCEINVMKILRFHEKIITFSAWRKGAGEQLQFLAQVRVQDQDVA